MGKSQEMFFGAAKKGSNSANGYLKNIADILVALVLHKKEEDNGSVFLR